MTTPLDTFRPIGRNTRGDAFVAPSVRVVSVFWQEKRNCIENRSTSRYIPTFRSEHSM